MLPGGVITRMDMPCTACLDAARVCLHFPLNSICAAARRQAAINAVMWDAQAGQWRDLVLDSDTSPRTFHLSNITAASNWVPLFAGLAEPGSPQALAAVEALQRSGLIHEGGLAATTATTGAGPASHQGGHLA